MNQEASPHHTGLPFEPAPERVIQTHCSIVLPFGEQVFKLKKKIKFPFLDYSTLELRRRFCLEELRLNRRFSPEYYLGTAVVSRGDGALQISEPMEEPPEPDQAVVDYAVVMKRIPEGAWLPRQIAEGTLPKGAMNALVERLIETYKANPADDETRSNGLPENLQHNTVANIAECERFAPTLLSRESWERLDALLRGWFTAEQQLFRKRVGEDRIRDGHGDLKPGNVAFIDGEPVITDCIEFNPLFRRLDTLCEVAFLATGLESLGEFSLAAEVFNNYREIAQDDYPQMLRRYYQAHLACVMGKVTALQLDDPGIDPGRKVEVERLAKHYFALADYHAREPHVVMVGGIMGCGKSTVAAALGDGLGLPVVNSDIERKRLMGVGPTERLPKEAYTNETGRKVYDELAKAASNAGTGVILDAQFPSRALRSRIAEAARAENGEPLMLLCDAPDEVVVERMKQREQDPGRVSDATADLLEAARENFEDPEDGEEGFAVLTHDTTEPTEKATNEVLKALLGENFDPAAAMGM